MTPKEHTLAMLGHYIQEIAYDRTSPEVILIHDKGTSTWAGMATNHLVAILKSEIVRLEAYDAADPTRR